ncbi:MAG: pyridoxal 5'-phosphate synthase glutaminase subunit PdxT [Bacillales bacterium]|jgi:5'-phosphate synthase pdxT subunit|nr:pyridoxal 5'-phosphate synthase glutaminase subunit PdxT [Bacillales bacterium]
MKIGILALQGGYFEHQEILIRLGFETVLIKEVKDLKDIEGLVLGGGESTTIKKLISLPLKNALIKKIEKGLPTLATCAGLILLAKEIEGEEPYLALLDIKVKRNAYGRQSNSFIKTAKIPKISENYLELEFIRAPIISKVYNNTIILLELEGNIVAVQQGNILGLSFHPELTNCLEIYEYFRKIINEAKLV